MYHPFRNLGLKFLSVGLAMLLWLIVAGDQIVERSARIPLEFLNVPDGLAILGDTPETVDVRVRGNSGALSRMAPGDLVAVLDLKGAKPGRRLLHLMPDLVRSPSGVDVVQISPPTITLAFERSGTRDVAVVPTLEGEPAPGYAVGKATVEPGVVQIIGPQSRLKDLTEATTEPVSVDGARTRIRETVGIGVPDPAVRLLAARSAVVTVEIVQVPIERTVENVRIRVRNLLAGVTARAAPDRVEVRVRGQRAVLNALDADSVVAFVDVDGLRAGRYSLTVRVEASADFGVTNIEPTAVQVRIR